MNYFSVKFHHSILNLIVWKHLFITVHFFTRYMRKTITCLKNKVILIKVENTYYFISSELFRVGRFEMNALLYQSTHLTFQDKFLYNQFHKILDHMVCYSLLLAIHVSKHKHPFQDHKSYCSCSYTPGHN